ncbi:MAG: SDR family NAD(P)-dependent oxidoreductase [Phycisphaerae bacterium]
MDILTGKRALVCGSTQGIGLACAKGLAEAGASVTLAARDQARLEQTAASLACSGDQSHGTMCADFCDPDRVQAAASDLIAKVGPHEILVNNTGGAPRGGRRPVPSSMPRRTSFSGPFPCTWSAINC